MQRVDSYHIDGAEIKREKNGYLIIGFSSQKITDSQIVALEGINEDFFLAFYNCAFSEKTIDFLANSKARSVGIFHSSFGDHELKQLSQSESLESLKLYDTKVTAECIFEIRLINRKLKIST